MIIVDFFANLSQILSVPVQFLFLFPLTIALAIQVMRRMTYKDPVLIRNMESRIRRQAPDSKIFTTALSFTFVIVSGYVSFTILQERGIFAQAVFNVIK